HMNQSVETTDGRLDIMEERRLISAAQKGCAVSSHRLIAAHQDRLHAFVWRMLRDDHDADEVCQDAFLRAFSALAGFDFNFRFSPGPSPTPSRPALTQWRRRRVAAGSVAFGMIGPRRQNAPRGVKIVGDGVANSEEPPPPKDPFGTAAEARAPPQ